MSNPRTYTKEDLGHVESAMHLVANIQAENSNKRAIRFLVLGAVCVAATFIFLKSQNERPMLPEGYGNYLLYVGEVMVVGIALKINSFFKQKVEKTIQSHLAILTEMRDFKSELNTGDKLFIRDWVTEYNEKLVKKGFKKIVISRG